MQSDKKYALEGANGRVMVSKEEKNIFIRFRAALGTFVKLLIRTFTGKKTDPGRPALSIGQLRTH